jgi:hypothetical protein
MKFTFKITTIPTLHAAITIVIVSLASAALALLVFIIGNPTLGAYCAMILVLVLWLVLFIQPHIAAYVLATPPPSKPKGKKIMMDPDAFCSPANGGVPQVPPASPHVWENGGGGGAPDIPMVAEVFHDFPPPPASLGASQRGGVFQLLIYPPQSSCTILPPSLWVFSLL